MSVLKTEILFEDLQAEKLNIPDRMIWATHYLDLEAVVGFGEFYMDSELILAVTEVNIQGVGSRVINISVDEFAEIYSEYRWSKKDILNTLDHNQIFV